MSGVLIPEGGVSQLFTTLTSNRLKFFVYTLSIIKRLEKEKCIIKKEPGSYNRGAMNRLILKFIIL